MSATNQVIAVLDVGMTTGVAVAEIVQTHATITVIRRELASVVPADVPRIIATWQPQSVMMESRPLYSSQAGTTSWMLVHTQLQLLGYKDANFSLGMEKKAISYCKPGVWKPVMRVRKINFGDAWVSQTDHEKDALNLLHYWLSVNAPVGQEIIYA